MLNVELLSHFYIDFLKKTNFFYIILSHNVHIYIQLMFKKFLFFFKNKLSIKSFSTYFYLFVFNSTYFNALGTYNITNLNLYFE